MATRKVNPYKVPQKQWKKWSPHAQALFNNLYHDMLKSQWVFGPSEIDKEAWQVISWNAAWSAASLLDELAEHE
jgi:hypothetical protein